MIFRIFLILLFQNPFIAYAKLSAVTTTTDLKWLVQEIGGNKVDVESLLNGTEDPHFIDAMPSFIGKVANSDMFCLVGLDLEVGWVPKILARSGNKQAQPGGRGYCETGKTVKALDIPKGRIDRSQGDVHPMGNPHYHLGPEAFIQGGETVLNTLINLDSKNSAYYIENYRKLKKNIKILKNKIKKMLTPIKNLNLMEYHREFTYFLKEFDLNNIGAIESAPGVPPSAGRLARVSIQAKQSEVVLALASTTSPNKLTDKFEEISNIPVARLSISIIKNGYPNNYNELLTYLATALIKKAKKDK